MPLKHNQDFPTSSKARVAIAWAVGHRPCSSSNSASAPSDHASTAACASLIRSSWSGTASYRRSLLLSMSNHIAKSVNWSPEMTSSATRTTVAIGIE